MSKNKLIWNSVLFSLIAIISLPRAYAQIIPAGTKIYFVLINAALIFVVLFILQAFLIPKKTEKETTSTWVIMILASLLLGYFFGQNGYLWEGPLKWIFNIFVLVNSAIIAAVLYFALGLLKIQNLQSTEGKTGYGILIFLFSVMIAINISPDKFLWNEEFVRSSFAFLFSPERGILNPKSGLLVFVTSFILISFFFIQFLLKGGNNKLNYALALIFAVNLAMPPVNPIKDVVQMGEIIFILIVWQTLQGTIKDNQWAALLLSILLVGWASAALTVNTPENRGAIAQMICHTGFVNCKAAAGAAANGGLFGTARNTLFIILGGIALIWLLSSGKEGKKFSGWTIGIGLVALILLYMWNSGVGFIGKIGLGLLLLLGLIGLIVYGVSRAEKVWEFGKIWERYSTLIRDWFWGKRDEIAGVTGVLDKVWNKRRIPPDMLPEILAENLIIYFSLNNYLKRFYIWNVKFDQVKSARNICYDMYKWTKSPHGEKDVKQLEDEIYICRNGGAKLEDKEVGLFPAHYEFCELINKISDFFDEYGEYIINGIMDPSKISADGDAIYTSKIGNLIGEFTEPLEKITRSYDFLEVRANAYGNYQPIKAQKYLVWDQCNPYGWHEHQYKFIEKGTRLINPKTGKEVRPADSRLEVNEYCQVIEDIRKGKDKFYSLKKDAVIRRVHPDEIKAGKIKDLPHAFEMMDLIRHDWEGFIKNMRIGRFRPNSKSAEDYIKHLSTAPGSPTLGRYDFYQEKNITFSPNWKEATAAFDRRALVNTGLLTYVGRLKYNEIDEDIIQNTMKGLIKEDPYPGVSTIGMSRYLPALVVRDTEDIKAANKYLRIYLQDLNEDVKSSADVIKTLGALKAGEQQK